MSVRSYVAIGAASILALPPLAGWFSATMPRHQLLQVPAMLILGAIAAGGRAPKVMERERPAGEWSAPILILAVGAMIFWMIPRSVDLAASSALADQLMHASWFLAGAALAHSVPQIPSPIAMALGIHGVAMLAAAGLVYSLYPGLICTAYNLQQQHATGRILLLGAPVLGMILWVRAIRRMATPSPAMPGRPLPPATCESLH